MRPSRSRRGLIDELRERRKPDQRRFTGAPFIVDGSGKVVFAPPMVVSGGKYFVFPARLSIEAWEKSGAVEAQAALLADVRADFEQAVAEERPEGEPPIYLRPRSRR